MRFVKDKRGQFIIIAALMIALMIISASAVMFSAVTYFRHERWEEYLIVIDGVKAGTANVLTVSLANYTQTLNGSVLKTNLDCWRGDVKRAYSGFGAILDYSLASGSRSAYGMNPNYYLGLNRTWSQRISFSAANVTASLNITSVGLTGYRFASTVFLKMNITDAFWYPDNKNRPADAGEVRVRVVIDMEGPMPVTNLKKEDNFKLFQIGGVNQTFSLNGYYESKGYNGYCPLNSFVYELRCSLLSRPSSGTTVTISVIDGRSIRVTGSAIFTSWFAPSTPEDPWYHVFQ